MRAVATHRREVQERMTALASALVDRIAARHPDGFEIRDFILVYHQLDVPDPEGTRETWAHAPYSDWNQGIGFSTTSRNWWVDEMIVDEAFDRAASANGTANADSEVVATDRTDAHEVFDRRVTALFRDYLDSLDEVAPHGWELADVGIVCQLAVAPPETDVLRPWEAGSYAGWAQEVAFATTSRSRWFELEMLSEVLAQVRDRRWNSAEPGEAEDDAEPEEEREGS
jgi:hypothetical protein